MMQLADNLHLLHKITNVLVSESPFFQIFFHCNLLTKQFAQKDLSISSFANGFNDFELFFFDEKSQFYSFFLEIV